MLPISTRPPTDLTALFDEEIEDIKRLLSPGSRRAIDASAKLRGLAILEGAVNGENHQPTPGELKKLAGQIKNGVGWHDIFPSVASLCISTEGEGPNISLRISKKEGVPIQLIAEGGERTGFVAVRRVNELDFYCLTLQRLSVLVGVGRNKLGKVIEELGIREDPDMFKILRIGKIESKLYSQKALRKLRDELPNLNVDEIWERRRKR